MHPFVRRRPRLARAGSRLLALAAVIAAAASPRLAEAQTGPVASYAFQEGGGSTTADASGSGITGTLLGGTTWAAGRSNGGLSFNGSTSYVDLGNPAALQITGSMTVSAWVFETANVGDDAQFVAKSDGGSGWQLKSTPDTGVRTFGFGITNASGAMTQRYGATVRSLNTWYHVAGVYDATARTLHVYVNGVLDDGILSGAVPAAQLNSAVHAFLGARTDGFHLAGILDDVRIHARALTQAEIQADMNTPVAGGTGDVTPPSVPAGLAATPLSSSSVGLTWLASNDDVGVAGYRVYRDGTQVGTALTTAYTDSGLAPSTTYAYAVAAYDLAGNTSAPSTAATATTQAPALDFALSNGGAIAVARGNDVTNGIGATLLAGTTTPVAFSATGLGAGMTAAFSPPSCSPPCSTTLTLTTTASTPTGARTLTVTGTGGGLTRTTSFTLTVSTGADVTPPTVAISAPAAGALLRGTATTVSATASDAGGVAGVQFLLDGADLGAEDTAAAYSLTWNTVTTADGPHVLAARARDTSGNTAVSADRTVTVDNGLPTGSVVINGGAAATNSRTSALALSASDATSGVVQMRFSNSGTSFSAAEAFAPTKTWTLSAGAGTKTVYAQFQDAAGNWSTSATDTIVLDTTAPTISAVATAPAGPGERLVTWTTSEPATSQVEYGPTTAYGTLSPLAPALVTAHAVTLTGLASGSYSFRVRSRDAAGNERLGANGTFTVTGADLTPPGPPTVLTAAVQSSGQVLLSWSGATDNVGVTGYLVFRDGLQIGSAGVGSFLDTAVLRNTLYVYTVRALDAAGNVSVDSPAATATTPPLLFSGIAASVTTTTALITWTTDVPATSAVHWGPTAAYGAETPEAPALVTAHSVTLTGLTPGTLYHFAVASSDASGTHVHSGDNTFSTTSAGGSANFVNEILLSGMNLPTALKFLPGGDMLIVELGGRVWLVPAGTLQVDPVPFLTLTNIGTLNGQQGLMDLVLDPGFLTNHQYYVFYTLGSPNRDRVSRFTATADHTGTVPGSELVIYQDALDANVEHHGGALSFGNDGKLYVTTGEHFNPDWSQMLSSPRGKVLRYNTDGTVPTDNPFFDGAGPNFDAIWALGLRNPYRAFYDGPSGRYFVGDVGGNVLATSIEELNVITRGANYGWPTCEGNSCASNPAFTGPIFSYPHSGRDAAITAGFVYRGAQFPAEYYGNFFYADYARNYIRRLTLDAAGAVTGDFPFEPPSGAADGPYGDIVYLTQGPEGALYYVDLGYSDTTFEFGVSKIRRIRYVSNNQPPVAVASASPVTGPVPLTVNFSSAGSFDPEGQAITYLWTFGDGTTSTVANPAHVYGQVGPYAARLTVSDGNSSTLSAPIDIDVGNRPVPVILSPVDGSLFRAGDVITVTGDASDAEDGVLPDAAFTWSVDFLHEGHVHPGLPRSGTRSFTFPIDVSGHDYASNTRYRITLTVTDSTGLQASKAVLIYPDKVNLTFTTAPAGLTVTLDGIPHATPFVYDTLKGFQHTLGAPDQPSGGSTYTFASWSDGGASTHVITVPDVESSYTAVFDLVQNPLPPGLLGGWRLDEGTGTSVADVSGNGITGALVGGPTWTAGMRGNALDFSGTTQYVDLGNPAALQLTGSMTLTAWIRISTNPGDDGAIVAKLGGAGWQLKTSPDTGARTAAIQISSNGVDAIQRYSATTLQAGTWYHLAGVYDAAARKLSIYLNGALDDGVLSGTVPPSQWNSTENVNLAQRTGFPGVFNFRGTIDEVHVFGRALSAAEIAVDMSTPR